MLFYKEGNMPLREPLTKKIRFRANTFFKAKQPAPLLNKDAYLFQVDKEVIQINPDKILDSIEASKVKESLAQKVITPPEPEVDLHIEKLTRDYNRMGNAEILQLQLQTFESKLENAIAAGMPQIIFIHGVGNGILRMEIHKRLGKNPNVSYFKDAMKEKFGYGATLAKIK
jgi:dsDNA-specific endonuclease/ATPase MutS2